MNNLHPPKQFVTKAKKIALKIWAAREGEIKSGYLPIDKIPPDVRMDIDRSTAGSHCQTYWGGYSRAEHGYGDPYCTTVDRGDGGETRHYKMTEAPSLDFSLGSFYAGGTLPDFDLELGVLRVGSERIPTDATTEKIQEEMNEAIIKLIEKWNQKFAGQSTVTLV